MSPKHEANLHKPKGGRIIGVKPSFLWILYDASFTLGVTPLLSKHSVQILHIKALRLAHCSFPGVVLLRF